MQPRGLGVPRAWCLAPLPVAYRRMKALGRPAYADVRRVDILVQCVEEACSVRSDPSSRAMLGLPYPRPPPITSLLGRRFMVARWLWLMAAAWDPQQIQPEFPFIGR